MRRLLILAGEAARTLSRHPLRSFLSAATCAVAIAVTVNVISLVYGLDADIRRDTSRFGRRTVDVARLPVLLPGREREDLGAAERAEIEDMLADLDVVIVGRRLVAGRADGADGTGDAGKVGVVAVPPTYLSTLDVPLAAGRFLAAGDAADAVCVVDGSVAGALFPGAAPSAVVGRDLRLWVADVGAPRRIVGVLEDPLTHRAVFESFDEGRSTRTMTSALLSFRNVYVPEDAYAGAEYSGISVVVRRDEDVDRVASRLRERWSGVDLETRMPTSAIGVFVRRDWMDLIGSSAQTGAFLSNLIWIIIVGVAIVMVSTLDLLTIRERYDELAVRRVEGARRADIAWQIAIEGVLLALAGGLAGLPLGLLGAFLLRRLVGFPFRFELRYALVATAVAAGLGLLAAVLPARHAAGLQPVRVLTRRRT